MNKLEIVCDKSATYPYEDIVEFFGFGEGTEILTERKSLLGIGANHGIVSGLANKYPDYYKMFLLPEEPNGFFIPEGYSFIQQMEKTFDLIYTICKYTRDWRKTYFGIDKRVYTFTPFLSKFSYPNQEKTIPVYFTGYKRLSTILPYIYNAVKTFNGTIVDASQHKSITHDEKMMLNGKSKISITYGLLFIVPEYISSIKSIPHWAGNEAFKNLNSGFVPQMKTRVHEAALSKSIILHKWDEWNVIEDWYTPNEDFIYFDNEKDLLEKINEINKNYDAYKYIAENAYNKFINNYTTSHFIDKYIIPYTQN